MRDNIVPLSVDAEAGATESHDTDTAPAAGNPAGEMMLGRRGRVGARARALAGFSLTVGLSTVIAASSDTTIVHPLL
jgi:hypothetical protein